MFRRGEIIRLSAAAAIVLLCNSTCRASIEIPTSLLFEARTLGDLSLLTDSSSTQAGSNDESPTPESPQCDLPELNALLAPQSASTSSTGGVSISVLGTSLGVLPKIASINLSDGQVTRLAAELALILPSAPAEELLDPPRG